MSRPGVASFVLIPALLGTPVPAKQLSRPAANSAARAIDPIFRPLLKELRSGWGRPVRLPAKLPDLGQGKDPLYAVLSHAARDGYTIYLAFTPDCNGASACRFGTLSGQKATGAPLNPDHSVRLANGVTAEYAQSECGANCSDALIRWREGTAEYSAGVKGGSREDALLLANSCLKR